MDEILIKLEELDNKLKKLLSIMKKNKMKIK